MSDLGIGIIGAGNISTAYLQLGPLFKGLDFRAIADINPAAAQGKAEEFCVRADSVEDLLVAGDIDLVVNLTVPQVHFEVSSKIIEAGKHVYSEKPFVLSLEEGQQLRDLAAANKVQVGSAPDTFLGGVHQQARAMIDAGDMGTVVAGSCHVMSRGMEDWHPNPDFFFQPGGGPVLDLGPYYVSNLVQLLGPVRAVTAMASASFPTRTIGNGERKGETVPVDTPTNIHGVLEFKNGALITLSMSWDVMAHGHRNMELYGTAGSLIVPDPNFFGGELISVGADKVETIVAPWDHTFGVNNMTDNGGTPRANYRCAGLADMAVAIAESKNFRCNQDLALHVVDVMTSILRSAEQRSWVEMQTTCDRPEALSAADAAALMK